MRMKIAVLYLIHIHYSQCAEQLFFIRTSTESANNIFVGASGHRWMTPKYVTVDIILLNSAILE